MTALTLILMAWGIEAVFGWPNWIYERIRHPVVWIGSAIRTIDETLNQAGQVRMVRYMLGALASCAIIGLVTGTAMFISWALPETWWGWTIEALIASSLIATRSLYQHVSAVQRPLALKNLSAARQAVGAIVGRDPAQLDEPAIARASLESLAENASDGVIAPVFWGSLFGLPGIAAYKAVNTLDSMIGHRTKRHAAFGGFAARIDDIANLIPARLTALLLAAASLKPKAFTVMMRDASRHRSPNAGWPEAAMAGALGVRLSGPRRYGDTEHIEPWLNQGAPDPDAADLKRGLGLYCRAMVLGGAALLLLIAGVHYAT
nr:adenosylcobinamide-phosphate synthase CbiB [Hyphomonas sp. Mor2]